MKLYHLTKAKYELRQCCNNEFFFGVLPILALVCDLVLMSLANCSILMLIPGGAILNHRGPIFSHFLSDMMQSPVQLSHYQ